MSDQDPHDEPTRVDTPVTDPNDPTMAMPAGVAGMPPTDPAAAGGPPFEPPPPTGEPPDEPRDRRPWIIGGLIALVLLVLLLLLFLGGDDDEGSEATTTTSTTSSTTSSTTTTTTAPTTTTTAPPTTTTSPPATIDPARCVSSAPDDPDTTAEVVYDAYAADDVDCASNLMTAEALGDLFAIPGGGGGWTFQGCEDVEDPDPQTHCRYSFTGGSTTFRMNYGADEGWTVFGVFQTAD